MINQYTELLILKGTWLRLIFAVTGISFFFFSDIVFQNFCLLVWHPIL